MILHKALYSLNLPSLSNGHKELLGEPSSVVDVLDLDAVLDDPLAVRVRLLLAVHLDSATLALGHFLAASASAECWRDVAALTSVFRG